jgi:hypothetical protein
MTHPNGQRSLRIFCCTWRRCRPCEYHCFFIRTSSLMSFPQVFSPAKAIFAGIGVLFLDLALFLIGPFLRSGSNLFERALFVVFCAAAVMDFPFVLLL